MIHSQQLSDYSVTMFGVFLITKKKKKKGGFSKGLLNCENASLP